MTRKLIIDGDMGTDDAVALCMLMFDSRVELVGLTAVEGCVTAEQANHNLQAIVAELDPARHLSQGRREPERRGAGLVERPGDCRRA